MEAAGENPREGIIRPRLGTSRPRDIRRARKKSGTGSSSKGARRRLLTQRLQHKIQEKKMSRSTKKGPFINEKLHKKVVKMNEAHDKKVLKTWARASVIPPDFVGHT